MTKVKRLFYDLETSPNIGYFWQSGYRISIPPENIIKERQIICVSYKWEGEPVQTIAWKNGNDKSLVKKFIKIARQADELIAHNGDKFDLKWLNTRCLIHGINFPEAKTVDTLVIARRRFRFNSNKLDYIANYLFGENKISTSFSLWKNVCNGDKEALAEMVRYCEKDVVLLERVWNELQKFHKPKTHAGTLAGYDRWTCPECASENVHTNKTRTTTAGNFRFEMKCKDCLRHYTISKPLHEQYRSWHLRGNKPHE